MKKPVDPKAAGWKLVATSFLIALSAGQSQAADGIWNVDADGNWSGAGNWLGAVADGPGSTAWFTNDISGFRTITLDTARTIGSIFAGDSDPVGTPSGWIFGNGGTAANSLNVSTFTVDAMNGQNGFDATNDVIVSAVIAGSGFTKKGAGTLTLQAANTMGPIKVDEGLIAVASGSALGGSSQRVIYDGGGIRIATSAAVANTNEVLSSGHVYAPPANYDAFNGVWTGSGTMYIHATSSRFTPGGGNANALAGFTGTIHLSDSINGLVRLNLGGGSTYDCSAITFNMGTNNGRLAPRMTAANGTFKIGALWGGPGTQMQSSEQGGGNPITLEIGALNQSTVFEGRFTPYTSGRIGHVRKVGTGTLTLTHSSHTYIGNTLINQGTLALSNTASIASSPVITVASGAIFDVSALASPWSPAPVQAIEGNGVVTGNVAVVNGTIRPGSPIGTLTFTNGLTMDGNSMTATNLFEITGPGTSDSIVVGGDLTFAGTVAIRVVPTGATIPNGTYTLFRWGGSLLGDGYTLALEYPAQLGTLTLVTDTVAKTISLQVTGVSSASSLVWRGDGLANDWDVATTTNWRNGGSASVFNNGDKVTFDDSGSNNVPVNVAAAVNPSSVVFNATKSYVLGSTAAAGIIGTSALVKSNTGVLTIATDSSHTGGTLIQGGTLQLGDGANLAGNLGSGSVTNNAILALNRPDTYTVANEISGSGVVVQRASGAVATLSTVNTYSGGTVISNNGTISLNTYTALGSGPIQLSGGALITNPGGGPTSGISNNVHVTADSTFQYNATGTYGSVIFGALTGLPGVTLNVLHASGGPDRLRLYGNFTNNANLNLNDPGIALAPYAGGGVQIFNGVISGAGQIINRGGGASLILNAQNTYTGGTTLTTGNLGLGIDSIESGGIPVSGPVGTGNLILANEGAGSGGNAAIHASGGPRTLHNAVTYPNNVAFTLIVGGSNNLTLAGSYSLNGSDSSGNVERTIQVNNTGRTTIAGPIGDSGLNCGLLKTGPSTLVLAAANTYMGATTVSAGSLIVNGSISGSGVAVTNGVLGGTGTVEAPVTVSSAGAINPGDSGIGLLTVNANVTLNGTLVLELNRTNAPSNCDRLTVSGVLSGGTLLATNVGPELQVDDTFQLFPSGVSGFAAVNLATTDASGKVYTWQNNLSTLGSIKLLSVSSGVNTTPTNIVTAVSGNSLTLSWPEDHIGWRLQTNAAGIALTNMWFDYPGSTATNQVEIPITKTQTNVFFRLVYP